MADTSDQTEAASTSTWFSRCVGLFIGPLYLLLMTGMFYGADEEETPLWVCFVCTIGGAVLIVASLIVFGVKVFRNPEDSRRFGLATIMLLMVPLAVYLANLRWLLVRAPVESFTPIHWLVVSFLGLAYILGSTAILLWFTEAAVWMIVVLRRGSRGG